MNVEIESTEYVLLVCSAHANVTSVIRILLQYLKENKLDQSFRTLQVGGIEFLFM